MFDNLDKKFFNFIVNICQFIGVALVFLAFFIILYWILNIGKIDLYPSISHFFESIKAFMHLFYKRVVVIDGKTIDFSFLVAAFLCLAIAWGLKFIVECIRDFEIKYFEIKESLEKKAEDIFNKNLNDEYLHEEYRNNKILMLINFDALSIKKNEVFRKPEMREAEKIEVEKIVLNDFFERLDENIKSQSKMLEDGVLLYFNNFNKSDDVIFSIENIVSSLKEKYNAEKWQIDYLIGIDTYSQTSEMTLKAKKLKVLLNISLKSEIACLGTFKQRYSLLKKQNYSFESKGIYKIEDNEEVFILKKLK